MVINSLKVLLVIIIIIIMGCDNNNISLPSKSETYVSGSIKTNTIWDTEHNPYIITGDVLVRRGITLTIHPGVNIRFDGFYGLTVEGVLIADGMINCQSESHEADTNVQDSEDDSIITFYQVSGNKWKGIKFDNTNNSVSIIRHVRIENAQTAIDCFSSTVRIEDSFIVNNNTGISLTGSFGIIEHSLIADNVCGILTEQKGMEASQMVKNSIVRNETGIVSYSSSKTLILRQNNFIGNLSYAVIARSRGKVVDARENWWNAGTNSTVQKQIYDKNDDTALGHVWYVPFANDEITDAYPRFCIEK